MSSKSSRSSGLSSRTSNTSRSTSYQKDARSFREVQEDLEAYDLQIANAKASKQHALNLIKEAEAKERALTQAREQADKKRSEMMMQSPPPVALDIKPGLPPAVVLERSPDDYVDGGLNPKTPKSGDSQSGKSSKSSKSRRGRFEVVGISRPARPKTIWGTPAWK